MSFGGHRVGGDGGKMLARWGFGYRYMIFEVVFIMGIMLLLYKELQNSLYTMRCQKK